MHAYVQNIAHAWYCNKKSDVDLIHDGSPHLQFDLMQVQAMAHLPAFAMFCMACLFKVPIRHEYFQVNKAIREY